MMEINMMDYEMSFVEETNSYYEEEYKTEYEDFLNNIKVSKETHIEIMIRILGNLKDWVWVGGTRYTGYNKKTLLRGEEYFDKYFNYKRKKPEYICDCICGHDITENCWIYNKNTDVIITVGNCCIKKFFGNIFQKNGKIKKCRECGTSHKNKKSIYCNDCKDKYCLKCCKPAKGYKYCFKCYNNN